MISVLGNRHRPNETTSNRRATTRHTGVPRSGHCTDEAGTPTDS